MDFQPNKRLGQNFLINQRVVQKIIKTADLHKDETILEVGPGLGALTQELVKRVKKVVAVEKDGRLAEKLKIILKNCDNIEIIAGDVLEILKGRFRTGMALESNISRRDCGGCARKAVPGRGNYKVVSNIPYYLTSPLIRMFLETSNPPQEMILLVQKEVAQRICALPPKMNLLAVSVQFYAQPEIISYVSKESFQPQPKVDSAIIKIADIKKPENIDIKKFFQVVKIGFSSPRKQLANNLSNGLNRDKEETKRALVECGLDPQTRAQNLSVENWEELVKIICA